MYTNGHMTKAINTIPRFIINKIIYVYNSQAKA